jgi:hypothetical protein
VGARRLEKEVSHGLCALFVFTAKRANCIALFVFCCAIITNRTHQKNAPVKQAIQILDFQSVNFQWPFFRLSGTPYFSAGQCISSA